MNEPEPKAEPSASVEKIIIDGATYSVPVAVACELLRLHLSLQPAPKSEPQAFEDLTGVQVCCGDFAKCHRPCTPRGWWLAQQLANLPERNPNKPSEAQGLYHKFVVRRADGSDNPGGKHEGCEYFVLDVDHDLHAKAALRAYALACADTHPQLSADLFAKHGTQQPALKAEPLTDDTGLPPRYMLAKLQMVMPLFQEARDALPAITEVARKLHGISPTLGDRMDIAGTFSPDDWNAARGITALKGAAWV